MSDGPADLSKLQKMAWGRLQQHIEEQSAALRQTIQGRSDHHWPDDDEVAAQIDAIDDDDKREELLSEAFLDLQKRVITVALSFLAAEQQPEKGTDELKAAVEDLLIGLHNPQTREALLIAVEDQHRDDVRERFHEFGQLFWGLADANSQRQTDEMWFLLNVVAVNQGQELDEYVKEVPGVEPSQIPDEYR